MSLSNNIYKLRSDYKLSQDEFAAKLEGTRRVVTKRENGTAGGYDLFLDGGTPNIFLYCL